MKLFILALISFTLGSITQISINKYYDKEKEIKNNKKFEVFFVNIPIKALPIDLKFKVTPKTSGHYKINCDAELIKVEWEGK